MGFHGTAGHVELFGNLRVVTALEQQFGNLPFPWAQLDELFRHVYSPGNEIITRAVKGVLHRSLAGSALRHPAMKGTTQDMGWLYGNP